MTNINYRLSALAFATTVILISVNASHAAPVTGPWTNADGFGTGPITNENTNGPTVGDGTSSSAAQEMIFSPFTSITLANAGDKVVFTGSVTLTGTVNSPATSATPRTQYRFGLFKDDDGSTDELGWVGYYTSNKHGNAGTPSGVLASKPVANTSAFLSVTNHVVLASVQGDGTAASLFHDDTYDMNLTVERNATGELLVSTSLVGDIGFSQMLSGTDTMAATAGTYTFDRLGFLLGNNLGTDQAVFADLDVTFIPATVAGLIGDYNDDDSVDAADYVVWRKAVTDEATTLTNRDPLNEGPVGPADYASWRTNFGRPEGGGGAALDIVTSVPEPASSLLVIIGGWLLAGFLRRRS